MAANKAHADTTVIGHKIARGDERGHLDDVGHAHAAEPQHLGDVLPHDPALLDDAAAGRAVRPDTDLPGDVKQPLAGIEQTGGVDDDLRRPEPALA